MKILFHKLFPAFLALAVSAPTFAQSNAFEYRVYQSGLRAAAAPGGEVEEEPAAPAPPPEIPDPHIANVQSLLHMDAFSGSGPLDQKGHGWAGQNISLSGPAKFGSGALAFTQATSWAEGPTILPYGDYTIEAWVNPSASTGVRPVVARWSDTHAQKHFLLAIDNGVPRYRYYTGVNISGGSAPVGVWTHIAVMNRQGAFYLFVNGVQISGMAVTDMFPNSNLRVTLGNTYNASGTMGGTGMTTFSGLIDDVRITRAARYVQANGWQAMASFPVPDRAFTNP
jgi:hypothetical protein